VFSDIASKVLYGFLVLFLIPSLLIKKEYDEEEEKDDDSPEKIVCVQCFTHVVLLLWVIFKSYGRSGSYETLAASLSRATTTKHVPPVAGGRPSRGRRAMRINL
jgi:hypothetical protein